MNETQSYDLKGILKEQERFLGEVQYAERRLSNFTRRITAEIKAWKRRGFSSGDVLDDEIMSAFGVDVKVFETLRELNSIFRQSGGKELLIMLPYFISIFKEAKPRWGYIFGTSNGHRLSVSKDKSISLPFQRFCTYGFIEPNSKGTCPMLLPFQDDVGPSTTLLLGTNVLGLDASSESLPQVERAAKFISGAGLIDYDTPWMEAANHVSVEKLRQMIPEVS